MARQVRELRIFWNLVIPKCRTSIYVENEYPAMRQGIIVD